MFTLKFYKSTEDHQQITYIICGLSFTVEDKASFGYIITVYRGMTTDTEGVRFYVSREDKEYSLCYIENSSGKTIATYRAFEDKE